MNCADCATPVSPKSTGRCRTCANRVLASCPKRREKIAERQRERWARDLADPVKHAAMVAHGVRLRQRFPTCREGIAKANATRRAMHWVPVEYEALNDILRRKKVPAAERRQLIAAQAVADQAARLAAMKPFERQLERVRNGARLIEVRPMVRAGYNMTLAGVVGEL